MINYKGRRKRKGKYKKTNKQTKNKKQKTKNKKQRDYKLIKLIIFNSNFSLYVYFFHKE